MHNTVISNCLPNVCFVYSFAITFTCGKALNILKGEITENFGQWTCLLK